MVDGKGGAARLRQRLGNRLGPGAGTGEEDAWAGRIRDGGEVVTALEETVVIDRHADFARVLLRVRVADDAGHQYQQVQRDLDRLAGKRVLRLDDDAAVDGFADFRHASADEMDAAVALRLDVEIFVFLAEEAEVHVEAVNFRVREFFLHLDGLLDGGDAADLGALRVAGLEVAGTHAMHETDGARMVHAGVLTAVEPLLEVAVGDHAVVDAVAVFFLLGGVEKMEAGGE